MRAFELQAPKPGTSFVVHRGRLALFHEAAEERAYWGQYWLDKLAAERLRSASRGSLEWDFDIFWDVLGRYLPKGSTVLEAGCGAGNAVAALNHRGYLASGVDYVPQLVEFATITLPGIDIRLGDVEDLPFADESFDCYASLGVAEHFEHGPERVLAEACRVLRPGGFAYIEVPYLNALRRAHLHRLARSAPVPNAHTFHQYYFDVEEFTAMLEQAGFVVLEHAMNSWESGLLREHPILSRLWRSRLAISRVRRPIRELLRALPILGPRYGHTIAFGCRKRPL